MTYVFRAVLAREWDEEEPFNHLLGGLRNNVNIYWAHGRLSVEFSITAATKEEAEAKATEDLQSVGEEVGWFVHAE